VLQNVLTNYKICKSKMTVGLFVYVCMRIQLGACLFFIGLFKEFLTAQVM